MGLTMRRAAWLFLLAGLPAACSDDDSGADDGAIEVDGEADTDGDDAALETDGADGDDADVPETDTYVPHGPTPEFDRFCQERFWDATLEPGIVGELGGEFLGVYNTFPAGTLETMKVIPPHPFHAKTIRVAFQGGRGTARIRLMKSFGHSYPLGYPDLDAGGGDLVTPVELELSSPDGETWQEIDVSDQDVYLLPTEHYMIVYEHLSTGPYLAMEELLEGDVSRGQIHVADEDTPYGMEGNYRMQLGGDFFCAWSAGELWFEERTAQPFEEVASSRASIADIDGDGHDDLMLNDGSPSAWLGDGAGDFAEPGFEPFPDVPYAQTIVFGDVDNDGDVDAFAATNVSPDGDGDGVLREDGDCDNADATVHPGAAEVLANGKDDDCDGTADDGMDTTDADADGVTIADGDCNDTLDTVHPGAMEIPDNRDNDCDGEADEDFFHRVLLNDGTGRFTAVTPAGVESIEPTAAAAFGDGDADGRLDLYWGNWLVHYPDAPAVQDHYVTGNGDGTFDEATTAAGMRLTNPLACYGVLWNDFNNDGAQDVQVNEYGYGLNRLWQNDGSGRFTNVGTDRGVARDTIGSQGGNTFGGDWGDFDNDGDLDVYEANIAHPRYAPWSDPSLMLVSGGPPDFNFTDQREALGLHYDEGDVNAAFADFDNDGDLDLVVASLYPWHFSRLYRNDGPAGFTDVTYETGTAIMEAVSAVWSDFDEDGDLDLVLADRSGAPYVHVFINRIGRDHHWLELDLAGTDTNHDAIGARVTLTAGGTTQLREVKGGGGHSNTQSTRIVHFGLGGATAIDSLTVRWVGGATETITGLEPDHRYRVVEGSGHGTTVF